MRYWVGCDFGQAADYTAVCVVERVKPKRNLAEKVVQALDVHGVHDDDEGRAEWHVRLLDRPPLRTPYDRQVQGVLKRIHTLGAQPGEPVGLIVDATGVGRAIKDMLKKAIEESQGPRSPKIVLKAINITGGNKVNVNNGFYNVPKRDLIHSGVVALQNKVLRIGRNVDNRDVLVKELLNYRLDINIKSGHDTYEPWRDGEHDDLLFSVCLATWAAERFDKQMRIVERDDSIQAARRPVRVPWAIRYR